MTVENQLIQQLDDVGNRLLEPPDSIPELLDLLDEVGAVLSKVGQKPSESVKEALLPSMKGLIVDELFRNSNPDIKITLAACLNEIMRISAPVAPYDSKRMKGIFELIVSSFDYLSTLHGRCYSKAVVILENVARLRSCVMMLDLDCDPLVTKMFELLLKNVSSDHPRSVVHAMERIMSVLIKESDDVSHELLEVLLASQKKENQDISPAAWKLGAKVIEDCLEKLRPYLMKTVVSMGSSLEDYAPVLSEVCKVEHDTVIHLDDDSSKDVVNSKPSADKSDSAEFVQALKAKERSHKKGVSEADNKATGDLRTKSRSNTSKRRKKQSIPNPNEGNENSIGKGKAMTDEIMDSKGSDYKQLNKGTLAGARTKKKGRQFTTGASGLSGNKENTSGASRKDKSQMRDASKSKSQRKRAFLEDDDVDGGGGDDDNDDLIETPYGRKSYKEDIVGCKIKVWWPLDRSFYEGTISSYNASTRKHRVDYDDGDKEILILRDEIWEFIGDEPPVDIDLLLDKKKTRPHSDGPQRESSTESEKEPSQTHSSRRGTPESGSKSGDGMTDEVSKTTEKSKRPEVSSDDTKRPRLSNGQKS